MKIKTTIGNRWELHLFLIVHM